MNPTPAVANANRTVLQTQLLVKAATDHFLIGNRGFMTNEVSIFLQAFGNDFFHAFFAYNAILGEKAFVTFLLTYLQHGVSPCLYQNSLEKVVVIPPV